MTSLAGMSPTGSEKAVAEHNNIAGGDPINAAEQGLVATDQYGRALVEIDAKAESRLRRKINLHVLPPMAFMYLFCFIDRANIGNAKLAGLEKDLELHGHDYNAVLSIFYISYILFEIPSTVACKLIGPGWFLPAITVLFGVCSVCTGFVDNIHAASGVRFLLGIFEAGMMPGIAYYLSRWYRGRELAFYLSIYVVTAPLAGAFGGLLASAILTLDHFGTLHTWRMIFAIEGLITIGLGLLSFIILTDRPETARWLSQTEKDLAITRLKSERVGTTEVLDQLDKPKMLRGILSPVTLCTAVIFLLNNITVSGLAFFAPTIVKSIYPDTTVVAQQLHTVPHHVPTHPLRRDLFHLQRHIHLWCALQRPPIGTNVMFGNIGGLISTWSFLPSDAPDYHIGNGLNLATSAMTFLLAAAMWMWMRWDNHRREAVDVERVLEGFSQSEVQDLDWLNPGFKWRT
ncbi:MFS general substrate transporter [Aspergillus sclerotiicarbonarius CBS 121057]|uniref:MFS general substrate transporter n=1 Tax=Aspergillus sclerotiicarbonarius (strain CBS 121057 / IBT 28362) TaxID=1448318 RepID=A0A319EL92_ASPSB|nr:MFS general substrate transporter [Aspergillus sclerotiicarbonarius CBS 121057]